MEYFNTNIENFKLRKAEERDISLVYSLIKEMAEYEKLSHEVVGTEEILRKSVFEKRRAEILIPEYNGEVVGYVVFFYNFSTFNCAPGLYIEDIFIKKEFRKNGFGREIFNVLGKIAKEEDCQRMEWTCLDWNEPARKFYASMGAERMEDWTNHRISGEVLEKLKNGNN
ncbi:GNAT family N-acetyltransferase [Clostridium isatidis]|jgi:GNAT superfamily N-acetyltransferase|uniref:GNAT family N-acetyltransferase n=1 Tax=Clostridium isatidis TaxID=182773 RepID=A0A343JE30_9CLOT|nr:GNAT family N-acetyltransferase [Clostridium isatidis]ASW43788.1 GNAT family N-acetyltransferase [Clostridium isatidis]NLL31643.1 GNAT family N-acetyltransferase [Clostridiales bacterium]